MQERSGYYWDVMAWRNSRRVRAMDKITQAIYRDVMDEIWINGAISNDVGQVSLLTGWDLDLVTRSWPIIHDCLRPTRRHPDLFTSERLETERVKRNTIKKKRKEAAEERWKSYANAQQVNANAMQDSAIQVTSTSNKKQVTSISKTLAPVPGFDEFWQDYPRKTAKTRALKAWNKLAPDPDLLTEILVAIAAQKKTEQWQRRVIPHASTWLNEKRWEDAVEAPVLGPRTIAEVMKAKA